MASPAACRPWGRRASGAAKPAFAIAVSNACAFVNASMTISSGPAPSSTSGSFAPGAPTYRSCEVSPARALHSPAAPSCQSSAARAAPGGPKQASSNTYIRVNLPRLRSRDHPLSLRAVTMMHLLDGVGLWADIRCERPAAAVPVLFVDRDGVLIEDRGYVGSAADTRVYPDAPESVAAARALGYRVAIVTNQSGIARGRYDWSGFAAVQEAIDTALVRAATAVDAVCACAYHADGQPPYVIADHFWRKPNPGMILEGLRRLNGNAARSAMVGDQPGDVAAARAAGLGRAVLIDAGAPAVASSHAADAVARSLGEAVKMLAQARARQGAP